MLRSLCRNLAATRATRTRRDPRTDRRGARRLRASPPSGGQWSAAASRRARTRSASPKRTPISRTRLSVTDSSMYLRHIVVRGNGYRNVAASGCRQQQSMRCLATNLFRDGGISRGITKLPRDECHGPGFGNRHSPRHDHERPGAERPSGASSSGTHKSRRARSRRNSTTAGSGAPRYSETCSAAVTCSIAAELTEAHAS